MQCRASSSLSELRARNSSSPHDAVLLRPLSRLRRRHRSPRRLRPLRRPAGLSLHPPRLPSPHDPPKLLAGLLEVPKPPTPNTPATAFPDHPRQIPSIVLVAGEEENPSYLALRVPQRQRRRLPVTPLPPASYRHRLPQQPANCSETTGPPIGFSYLGQTPDAQMCGENVHFQPPSCHLHLVQESVTQDQNVKFLLCFPAVRVSKLGTSLVTQWLRIRLLMQGTWVRALVQEDPTCCGAVKPVSHNY
ncbi:hypothetical protein J1605_013074 [Eschrichtius robustus]|uniref:Uncharacterized protein n=1 Tax=Eschrichtius robustus TaxID=9764 RepID=A0AB34GJF4_ESCRO|nr:hypothetical protein J1605_013074 [Eschrichtius robustus]